MRPPCKKNGKDCPLRRAVCQARCDAYKEYRAEQDRMNAELRGLRSSMDFLCNSEKAANSRKYKKSIGKG